MGALVVNKIGVAQQGTTARSSPPPQGILQRQCACGTHTTGGKCDSCSKQKFFLQRKLKGSELRTPKSNAVPPIVHDVLHSPGQLLDAATRAFFEPRFGHDFSQVRVHTDAKAAESAQAVNSLAYTLGQDIVFGSGQYAPHTSAGRRLMAHELTHVVQQANSRNVPIQPQPQIERLNDGGYRIVVAPTVSEELQPLERQADAVADRVVDDSASPHAPIDQRLLATSQLEPQIQRARVPLPRSVPLCGKTLTHIDIEPPRWRPLEPCLPPTVLVNRINIVGRDLSVPSPGRGRQVFNLHIGYYRDPVTGRMCAIADDSKTCIASRCLFLGCFPTLREVLDAILDFLKNALVILGIIALAIIIAFIIELLGGILVPVAALAEGGSGPGPEDTGELASSTATTTQGTDESEEARAETTSEAEG